MGEFCVSARIRQHLMSAVLVAACMLALALLCVLQPALAHASTATKVTGVAKTLDAPYSKGVLKDKISVTPAYGRTVELYRFDTKQDAYVLEKTFKTKNKRTSAVTITYPASWKTYSKSTWKIVVPRVKKVTKRVTVEGAAGGSSPDARAGSDTTAETVAAQDASSNAAWASAAATKTVTVRDVLAKKSVKVKVKCDFLSCNAAVVMEADSGKVLYSHNPFQRRYIASVTKMMTATLLVERKQLSSYVEYTGAAVRTPYGFGFEQGEKLTVTDAVYAMMLPSSNETATAAGIAVSGSTAKFCKLMDKRAKQLGCRDTVYKNPHGLTKQGAHSTAYDQALIAANIMTSPKLSVIRKATKTKYKTVTTTSGNSYSMSSTNNLLGTSYKPLGIKTGFTQAAGYCFVGAFKMQGKTYVTVVLGANTPSGRFSNTKRLVKFAKYALKNKLPEYDL